VAQVVDSKGKLAEKLPDIASAAGTKRALLSSMEGHEGARYTRGASNVGSVIAVGLGSNVGMNVGSGIGVKVGADVAVATTTGSVVGVNLGSEIATLSSASSLSDVEVS
jgi:hypothetical protein